MSLLSLVTGLGALGAAAAYFAAGPERFWANWLLWQLLLLSAGLGSLFLVALEHLTDARWSIPLRRTAERTAGLLAPASAAMLAGLFALPVLYPWAHPGAALMPHGAAKSAWLSAPFFSARVVLCSALWLLAWRLLAGGSLEQDKTKAPALSVLARRFAPFFMALFALSVTTAAFDWLSSLEPEWYSDILGVYFFAGIFLAGLASVTLLAVHLIGAGRLPGVRFDHVYNLGGFLFAFTVFWSYIAFAQYLLMWYAHLPEEVFWYQRRLEGPWRTAALALAVFHFLIPFFALIPRDAKGDLPRLRWVAILLLGAHFLDLYWLIFPVLGPDPLFSWPEVSFALFFIGAALLWIRRSLAQGADMPIGDPRLEEGLAFRL
ncbi:MAG TPA: quinol:cytochrome C oxidoreductase [Elusimicrobia bacterium]|nr:quinol:cytochrome C oxidoreductase [Elusimicrobiota bacterium]